MKANYITTLFTIGCAASLIWSSTAVAEDKIYKWQDDNGLTHYSQSPPENANNVEEVTTSIKASSDQEQAMERLRVSRAQAAEARKKAQATPGVNKEAEKERDDAFAKRCAQHRKNLAVLINQPIVRQEDPKTGEMIPVDEERRQALIAETKAGMAGCPEQ